ncbi:MAG TPA: nucleotidyltransferase family protein [Chthoniobacterales bacterium]|nr:nucleotidyltransferase family protein [Chthoniobacterales bacterium]
MTGRALLTQNRDAILEAARRHGAISIRVFGSVARGEENAQSDVDFLVRMEPGRSLLHMGGLLADLEDLLGRKVDLVSEAGLRPRFREHVAREAVTL